MTYRLGVSAAVVFAMAFAVASQPPAKKDLSGIWQLSGQEGDDLYHGAILIEQLEDGSCKVATCTLDTMTRGVGIRKGNTLSVGWALQGKDRIIVGITVYTISADGKSLDGEWRTQGKAKMPRTEKARWIGPIKRLEI